MFWGHQCSLLLHRWKTVTVHGEASTLFIRYCVIYCLPHLVLLIMIGLLFQVHSSLSVATFSWVLHNINVCHYPHLIMFLVSMKTDTVSWTRFVLLRHLALPCGQYYYNCNLFVLYSSCKHDFVSFGLSAYNTLPCDATLRFTSETNSAVERQSTLDKSDFQCSSWYIMHNLKQSWR